MLLLKAVHNERFHFFFFKWLVKKDKKIILIKITIVLTERMQLQ